MTAGARPPTAPADAGPAPALAWGVVRHRRDAPAVHAFAHPCPFLLLPMRRLREHPVAALARGRRAAPLAFVDADHGDGGGDALAWFDGVLDAAGVARPDGEVWLMALPRVFGYAFKPVSFWLAEDRDGRLRAAVAEVRNTFGQRTAYVLGGASLAYGRPFEAAKRMHVSPFCEAEGTYRFTFLRTPRAAVARVALLDAQRRVVLRTSLAGRPAPLDGARVAATLVRWPLASLAVTLRIHRHALALWAKRVPWFPRPPGAPPRVIASASASASASAAPVVGRGVA